MSATQASATQAGTPVAVAPPPATLVQTAPGPSTQPFDLNSTRKWLVGWLFVILSAAVAGLFLAIVSQKMSVAEAKEFATGVLLPLFGLIAPIIGFFFARS